MPNLLSILLKYCGQLADSFNCRAGKIKFGTDLIDVVCSMLQKHFTLQYDHNPHPSLNYFQTEESSFPFYSKISFLTSIWNIDKVIREHSMILKHWQRNFINSVLRSINLCKELEGRKVVKKTYKTKVTYSRCILIFFGLYCLSDARIFFWL